MTKELLKVYIILSLMLVVTGFVASAGLAFGNHTTKGAIFWYNACKAVDYLIVEDCSTLVSNHDPYNQGLSTDGWRVAKCVAGGALVTYAGHPELLSLGPTVGCGGNTNNNPIHLWEGSYNIAFLKPLR